MASSDNINWQVELLNFFNLSFYQWREWIQNIGVIFHRLCPQTTLISLIGPQFFYGEVLTERIVREQNIVASHVRRHGIRPMEHAHFYEYQRFTVADIYGITCLHSFKIPFWMMILTNQGLNGIFCAVNRRIRDFFHQCWQGTTMINFAVITYDKINLV